MYATPKLTRFKSLSKGIAKFKDWAILVFVFAIPISQFLTIRLLLLILLLSFFVNWGWRKTLKIGWDIFLSFFVAITGLYYSEDFESGLRVLETSFSLFSIPFVFSSIRPLEEAKLFKLLWAFVLGLFVACVICLISASLSFHQTSDISSFFFYQFTDTLDFQPTYFAYYLVFAITFSLYHLTNLKSANPLWAVAILILSLFVVLLLTAGRTSFISLLLVFSFFVLRFFLEHRTRTQIISFCLILMMIGCMFATTFYEQGSRTLTLNDSWDRYDLWKSAISANENILFGVGTGDYKVVLNEYFRSHNMDKYAVDSLNSHNQFIHTYLSNGILGLVAFIFLLARPLYLSFRSGFTLGILVFFPFILYGMTEVFLGRYQGVVFFAFLHQGVISFLDSSKPAVDLKHA